MKLTSQIQMKKWSMDIVSDFDQIMKSLCRAIDSPVSDSRIERRDFSTIFQRFFLINQGQFVGNFHLHQQKQDDLTTAINDTRRAQDQLKLDADKFERQKVNDMQQVLMNFCEIELAFHARALELYTAAYNAVKDVEPHTDIEHFRQSMASTFAAKVKVGVNAVPVHVPSTVLATDGDDTDRERVRSELSVTEHEDDDTDTKEMAGTTTTDGEADELISEVAYLTPTDPEESTDPGTLSEAAAAKAKTAPEKVHEKNWECRFSNLQRTIIGLSRRAAGQRRRSPRWRTRKFSLIQLISASPRKNVRIVIMHWQIVRRSKFSFVTILTLDLLIKTILIVVEGKFHAMLLKRNVKDPWMVRCEKKAKTFHHDEKWFLALVCVTDLFNVPSGWKDIMIWRIG